MTEFIVANATELYDALSSAEGGDRIVLAGGDYGSLDFRGVTFSSDVTIVSADPDDPAIVRELYVRDASSSSTASSSTMSPGRTIPSGSAPST